MCNQPKPGTVDTNREGNAGGFKVRCCAPLSRGEAEAPGMCPVTMGSMDLLSCFSCARTGARP
jgi:hypothetical protein